MFYITHQQVIATGITIADLILISLKLFFTVQDHNDEFIPFIKPFVRRTTGVEVLLRSATAK